MIRIAAATLAALLLALPVAPASADSDIQFVTIRTVFERIAVARTVTLAAYSLAPGSRIVSTLVTAADRGARVSVQLGSGAFGANAKDNAETTVLLLQHHIEVHGSPTRSHIKAVSIDGALFLSDRNFASREAEGIVVLDSLPGDRTLVERSLLGSPGQNDHLATRKDLALAMEARVIAARASRTVSVSTESFGAGTPVFEALLTRRRAGDGVRLMVAKSEYNSSRPDQQAVAVLRAAGAEVRISEANEKYVVDGANIWFGSANQTRGLGDMVDFGIAEVDAVIAAQLASQFEIEWAKATQ